MQEVRPIGARPLKSAIDTLRPYLQGASVLDLYAGQGRFGIAAADEGISRVDFVENSTQTALALSAHCRSKKFPGTVAWQVHRLDALEYLANTMANFDVVFADPPFPLWKLSYDTKLLSAILRVLNQSAILLVKHPSRMVACSEVDSLKLWKETVFGESRLLYFEHEKAAET